jgi:hypothetical protein
MLFDQEFFYKRCQDLINFNSLANQTGIELNEGSLAPFNSALASEIAFSNFLSLNGIVLRITLILSLL